MRAVHSTGTLWRWAIICALLCGVFFRWASLSPMGIMLHYDEAWNGIDALALLQQPRLTPFLPNNFGRESGFVYWLIPYLVTLGATSFAIRFSATAIGILTLAAAGRLGKELWGIKGAFWSVVVLSVFYWHVHFSQQALRANLYVFLGTLTAALMLHAYRTNLHRSWALGGLALGLSGYTYFASAGWIGYVGILVLGTTILDHKRRQNGILSLLIALIVILPIGVYAFCHFDLFLVRPNAVALNNNGWLSNIHLWIAAWFQQGDLNHQFNLPGRPILDPITGTLGGLGLVKLTVFSHRRKLNLILIGWGIIACLPSLLSNLSPHFLRASGMTIAIALIIGAGIHLLGNLCERFVKVKDSEIVASLLLIPVAMITYHDFHLVWVNHPDTFVVMEQHINRATDYLRKHTSPDNYVYFSPFTPAHPVVSFRSRDLEPRHVAAFDAHQCLVLPAEHSANYVSLTMYDPGFQQRLAQWATVTPLFVDSITSNSVPRYSIFTVVPHDEPGHYVASFGDVLVVKLMQPLDATISAGKELPVVLGIQPLRTLDFAPSLFVHLYGTPTPYEGGMVWAQADNQLCVSYPAHLWRTDEMIVQSFPIKIPSDIPSDKYTIAIGIYPFPAGERLSVSDEGNQILNYLALHELNITESGE
jgi:hypothetical protein